MFKRNNTLKMYFFCFVVLLLVLFIPYVVNASTSVEYDISEIHMSAKLNTDGSVDIHELITYIVSPGYDWQLDKQINISRASEITDLEVFAISRDTTDEPLMDTEMMALNYVESPTEGQTGVYYSELVGIGQNQFKIINIFLPAGDENVTISLRYSLKDMIYIYNDVSLFQWQFAPQTKSDITGNISIEIFLPQSGINENIDAFVHGSEHVNNAVIDDSSVIVSTDGIKQGEFLEAIVLMPVNAVPYGRKFVENYIHSDMLEFKERLENEALQAKLKQEQRNRSVMTAALIILISGIGVGSYFYSHSLKKSTLKEVYDEQPKEIKIQSTLPEHYYTPAEFSALLNRSKITSKDMIATLMDMVVKGNLLLKADVSSECKTLRFMLNENCHIGRLEPHEEYLINWMLKDIGTGGSFSTFDIKSVASNPLRKGKFLSKFDTWARIVVKQAARWNFEQKLSGRPSKLTQFSPTHYAQWMEFKTFLKNFSDNDTILSLSDWERYMVFAVPLGEAEHLASRLLTLYPQEYFDNDNLTLFKRENVELFELWFDCITQGDGSSVS